jgi:hypothetical protein
VLLKVELHAHTSDDPADEIPHSLAQLLERAVALRYRALAVTLHDRQFDVQPFAAQAEDKGITLIRGIERTIEGRHVLLLNFSPASERVDTFGDLARLKAAEPGGLVVAPHPFFPGRTSLREMLDRHASLFDAVEYNAMFTPLLNFNRLAERWAVAHHKAIVGCGDVHRLRQLGTTYSLVEAEPTADAICEAIRRGHVGLHARPLSVMTAAAIMTPLLTAEIKKGRLPQILVGSSDRSDSTPGTNSRLPTPNSQVPKRL